MNDEFVDAMSKILDQFNMTGCQVVMWDGNDEAGFRFIQVGKTTADRKLANTIGIVLQKTLGYR